ncbi:MAG: immunoglobulin domain-containing protein [Oscillospiraceae bacterium]|nr:immunoglobulin domain-containing protein [Oscillospiraceae bacterium]
MKRTRKLLCLILSLVFMVGLLPTVAPIHAHASPPDDQCPSPDADRYNDGHHKWEVFHVGAGTCTEPGEQSWYCEYCGREYTEPTAPEGHAWSEWDNAPGSLPATCTQGSTEARYCSRCGASETRSVPALGHAYNASVTKQPTCTETGVTTYTCSRCGDSYTEAIPALGHDYSSAVTKEPTCTAEGVRSYTCSRGDSSYTEAVAALGHAWDGGTVTKEPSCTADGVKTFKCTRCGETRTESIAALGHAWDGGTVTREPTCTAAGERKYTCTRCGETRTETIDPLGHNYEITVTKEATCTEDGSRTLTCTRGDDTHDEVIPALGHDWDKGVTTEPQGLTDGTNVTTCKRCGETETQIIPAAPAIFNLARNVPPAAMDDDALVITTQPEGGMLPSGGSYTLSLEAAGGTAPYTYEWHWISAGLPDAAASWAQDRADQAASKYSRRRSGFSEAFHGAYIAHGSGVSIATISTGSLFSYGSHGYLSALTDADLHLNDHSMGGSDGPSYPAIATGRYYCIVRDAAGREAVSDQAEVTPGLYILQQPQNTNLHGQESVTLTCVAAGGVPFDDQYSYRWTRDGVGYGHTGSDAGTITVTEPGEYICIVNDASFEDLPSNPAMVYDAEPLTVTASPDFYPVDDPEDFRAEIEFTISGGVPAYQVEITRNGEDYGGFTIDGSMMTDGVFSETRTFTETGTYFYTVTDVMGNSQSATVVVVQADPLSIRKQPKGGEIPKEGTDPNVLLDIAVEGGTPPYIYALYRDGVYDHESAPEDSSNYGFSVREPGVFYLLVTDAAGRKAESDHVIVTQEAEKDPIIITEQPGNLLVDYKEKGYTSAVLHCEAISTDTEDDSHLTYVWQRLSEHLHMWFPVHNGKYYKVPANMVGNIIRCQIVDSRNEKTVFSSSVQVKFRLTFVKANTSKNVDKQKIYFEFGGGSPRYRVFIYQIKDGKRSLLKTYETTDIANISRVVPRWYYYYVKENGKYVKKQGEYQYYCMVRDAKGQKCNSDIVK